MINVAPIRAASRAAPGDVVALSKEQLDELLDEVEDGQRAKLRLKALEAIAGEGWGGTRAAADAGIDRVSEPH